MDNEVKMVSVPESVLCDIYNQFLNLHRCKGLLDTIHTLTLSEVMDSSDAAAENLEEIQTSAARMLWNIVDDGVDPLITTLDEILDKNKEKSNDGKKEVA